MNMTELAELEELRVMTKEQKETITKQKEVIEGLLDKNIELLKLKGG
ncbi:hypothetical protein [Methanobacterium spitsbergense]|uniref:Uncharacterized protein n=1 Tax=Methanobacterium spitsbergense TaxID=2874285 RepID=A0A8T5V514_9EURY|nr:hypothetical protein [Methanobacterium spitsbergense]MBZ2166981.1 hypothetical protein [Methanobacterium spitsbergense]